MSGSTVRDPEPIAIVGIGCRFPGADGPEAFWELIRKGVDAITDVPAGRYDVDALYDPTPGVRGKIVTRQGGFLADVDRFEPAFFGISPREAVAVDPQQRLLLEVAWEAFEDAGLTRDRMAGSRTGVYVGMWTSEYEDRMFAASSDIDLYVTTGGGRYAASGRLSYVFDLRGPSLTLDTACSSSLVAVHLACQSLRGGESEMALAGGVNLILEPHITIGYSRSSMLSADGRCRFGDASASGYVRSEGVGLILLKPLSRALADRDPIHALIRGSAVNNDGHGSQALVAPSPIVQAAMLRQAYRAAGVAPGRVGYVEAHGTGTRVGDPVELEALGQVLAEGRASASPCRVGSVKTNIGHTEAASGIAGLIKAVYCLKHRLIPPSLHLHEPNPRIPWDSLPLRMAQGEEPWPEEFAPAYAGVNSFGVTGTNAHVVLEEAPAGPRRELDDRGARRAWLLPLSAKTPAALAALAGRWAGRLETPPAAADLGDLCYTAAIRRTHHEHRLAIAGAVTRELAERLRAHAAGQLPPGLVAGRAGASRPRVVFVFPGQGSQWLGMGRGLLAAEPVFAAAIERCETALRPHVDWTLGRELAAAPERSQLGRIDVVQPALFAIQVALAALWQAWGVEPDAVVGHSMGEVAAAHVAGALSLEDAARVIAVRSRLLRRIAGQGAMALVELSLPEARQALEKWADRVSIAVANSARSVVLSGELAALDQLLADFEGRGVFCRRIKVDVASHSPQVEPLGGDLRMALTGIAPRAGAVPFYSTVTGEIARGEGLGAEYWVQNLRAPVLFASAVERLLADGLDAFVELSPHPVLLAAVQEALPRGSEAVAVASGRREEDEGRVLREALGALWVRGYPVDWGRLEPGDGRVVAVPSYPWQRERYWVDERRREASSSAAGHPLMATHIALAADPGGHVWDSTLVVEDYPCLHAAPGPVLGAAACLDALIGAAGEVIPGQAMVCDVRFPDQLPLVGQASVQVDVRPAAPDAHRVRVLGRDAGAETWAVLAEGVVTSGEPADGGRDSGSDPAAVAARAVLAGPEVRDAWMEVGPAPSLEGLWLAPAEGLARLADGGDHGSCPLHPAALEIAIRLLVLAAPAEAERLGDWRPVAVRAIRVLAGAASARWVHVTGARTGNGELTGDVRVLDAEGRAVLVLEGLRLTPPGPAPLATLLYEVTWVPQARQARRQRGRSGRWLLVGSAVERFRGLAACLEAHGDRTVAVDPGADAIELGARLDLLLEEHGPELVGVVLLDVLDLDPAESPTAAAAARGSWASALATVQALARHRGAASPRLWFASAGAQLVASDDCASLPGAALWGLGAVVAQEHPALRCTRVDLPLRWVEPDIAELAEELLADDEDDQVALRQGQRLVARLARRNAGRAVDGIPLRLVENGTYLVSGGFGGLGLTVAHWLVARGARHLVLVGRRGAPDSAAPMLAELRAAGAEVVVARGDVARPEDVRRIVGAIPESAPLLGIVHAAGVMDAALLVDLDETRVAAVMGSKVDGALNLHAATLDRPLDFFVLFSSVSAVLGVPGEGNYAPGNAVLDAFAARRRAEGRPALSIVWGPWGEVGLIAARTDGGNRLAARGLGSILPAEGLGALEALLGDGAAVTPLVMRFAPDRWGRAYPASLRGLLRDLCAVDPAERARQDIAARARAAAAPERRALLEAWLQEQVAQVLRLSPAEVYRGQPLKNLGLDSMLSLELRNRIERAFMMALPATVIWNYPTLAALAAHLEERLGLAVPEGANELAGAGEVERLLEEIEHLPEDEVRRLLAAGDAA